MERLKAFARREGYYMVGQINFRENIKMALKDKNIKQSHLAEKVGISKSLMSEFLSGKKDVKISTLEKIIQNL